MTLAAQANERAELEKAYSAGVRKPMGNTLLRSAAMTMSRTMLADEESKAKMDASRHAKPEPISEWDIVRLTQVFKSFDSNNSGCVVVGVIPLLCRVRGVTLACPAPSTISRDEFKHALDEASEMGMKLTIPHDSEVMDRYFAAMDTDGDEQVGIKEFLAVRCGLAYVLRALLSLAFPYVPVPTHPQALQGELHDADGELLEPLRFREMLPEEAKERSEHLFKQAAAIQVRRPIRCVSTTMPASYALPWMPSLSRSKCCRCRRTIPAVRLWLRKPSSCRRRPMRSPISTSSASRVGAGRKPPRQTRFVTAPTTSRSFPRCESGVTASRTSASAPSIPAVIVTQTTTRGRHLATTWRSRSSGFAAAAGSLAVSCRAPSACSVWVACSWVYVGGSSRRLD